MSIGITLNRETTVYGTINGDLPSQRVFVRSYNFLYYEVNRIGPGDDEVFVRAFMDGEHFITNRGEAEAITALIVAGGV